MITTLRKSTVLMMSIAAGVAAANTYYSQSILQEIADFLSLSKSQAGIIPAFSVAGYGVGLFFLTPLGDRMDRKKLILITQGMLVVVLLGISLATTFWQIYILAFFMGCLSITAQLLIPMAAAMDAARRSKNIGMIATGLLTGMLGAHAVSDYVTMLFSWQYVYAFSAFLLSATNTLLYLMLPSAEKRFDGSYREVLQSALWQMKRFPRLRIRAILGALIFATFCSLLTTLILHLGGPPFNLQADTIGLFSFTGIAGVITTLLSPYPLSTLILAIVLLDMGVRATQRTNLATIYQLDERAHNRLNTIYMTTCSVGGGLGTLAGLAYWI